VPPMRNFIFFLTQDETKRLLAVIFYCQQPHPGLFFWGAVFVRARMSVSTLECALPEPSPLLGRPRDDEAYTRHSHANEPG
jgi:hypothetical protein